MNELTRRLVTETAQTHKAAARRNDHEFKAIIESAWWDWLIAEYGVDLKERALSLWRACHPDHFDNDGFLASYDPYIADIEIHLSNIVVRTLRRRVEREPELRLEDWGELPEMIAEPQLRMF